MPELQDSSSSDEDNEPNLPDPEQFVMNDQKLKIRIKQLLHERPTYQALMHRAWSNTLNQYKVSSQTGSRYKAHVAIYLINQFEHLMAVSRPKHTIIAHLRVSWKDCWTIYNFTKQSKSGVQCTALSAP